MKNTDIRQVARMHGVRLWEIAEVIGISDGNFSRRLRREFNCTEKKEILEIIETIAKDKGEQ